MKKALSVILSILMLVNTALAYTSTIQVKGIGISVTSEEGNVVEIIPKTSEITGWTVKSGNTTVTDNKFVMPGGNVVIEGITKSGYTLTVEMPHFTRVENKEAGQSITIEATTTNAGYTFKNWTATGITLTSSQQISKTLTFTMPANAVTLVANYIERTVNADTSGANAPVIIDGLTPVNWNGSSWVATTEANWEYNYNSVATATQTTVAGNKDGAWANAQTADGSLYVWIPRYTYKITSGEHSSGKSWNSLDSAGSNKIEIKFSNGTTDNTTNSYKKHPAFTFGTDELKGIWVAKYEASQGTNTNTTSTINKPTATNYVAQSKPGVSSWRDIIVSKCYEYAYNTFRNADSHLMRNSEWGAVAYLTNAIGRIPYKNNNSNCITGIAGDSQDASESTSVTNRWNTAKGVKASTTHNVYGIYDLSGSAWEYVSAYYANGSSSYLSRDTSNKEYAGVLYTKQNTKYVETYETVYTSLEIGDAVYETSSSGDSYSNTSWDDDLSIAPDDSKPVFTRGGRYHVSGSYTGVFCFASDTGARDSQGGFRPVLSIK